MGDGIEAGARGLLAAIVLQAVKDAKSGDKDARRWLAGPDCTALLDWLDLGELQWYLLALCRRAHFRPGRQQHLTNRIQGEKAQERGYSYD